jgi:hypothetical protein
MYCFNKGVIPIDVDGWKSIFEFINEIGVERFEDFAHEIDRYNLDNANSINSEMQKLMEANKDIFYFFNQRKIVISDKKHTTYHKDSLSSFVDQLKQENMTPNDCIEVLRRLKDRGILIVNKHALSSYDNVPIHGTICKNENQILRYFSDEPIVAQRISASNCEWNYHIKLDQYFHWFILAVDYYNSHYNPNKSYRSMNSDSFNIDFNKVPTKKEIDDLTFNPKTQKGYKIRRSI